jgi:taurine dioxygenase
MYTVLYGVEIPHKDGQPLGDTVFTSAHLAYEALSPEVKAKLAGRRAVHSFIEHLARKARAGNLKRAPLTEKQKAELPDVSHPVVRTHPITGKPCLFVTEGHTTAIEGLPQSESDALLADLAAHLANPAFHYRHRWTRGDLIVWDNCSAHHLAVFDYGDIPRRLHRAGILGSAPI